MRAIRNIRAEKKVEPAKFIEAYVVADGARERRSRPARRTSRCSRARGRCTSSPRSAEAPREQVATAVLEGVTAVVPLAGLFDTDAERARLQKQIADAEAEAGRIEAKLANEQFRSKAPANIIATEEERLGVGADAARGTAREPRGAGVRRERRFDRTRDTLYSEP